MNDHKPQPHVSIAALCERVLTDKDGTLSLIRLIDTFTPERIPTELPHNAVPVLQFSVVVVLKSDKAIGKYQVSLRLEGPSGKKQLLGDPVTVVFKGEEHGISVVVQLTIPANQPGLAWIDVLLDDEVLTRIPFRVRPPAEGEVPRLRSQSHESGADPAAADPAAPKRRN